MPVDFKFYEKQLVQHMLAQEPAIAKRFGALINSASPLLARWKGTATGSVWTRNTGIERELDKLLKDFAIEFDQWLKSEQSAAWDLSNVKTDALVSDYVRNMAINQTAKIGMFARNADALTAFQNRRMNGMGLSDRVWNIAEETKAQLEFYLESGISTGRSAKEISRDIRQLMNNPDKVFRRVRDENGKLQPSKPMKYYHPGQGVYRSSYKNALRLAATETNMAYRMADHDRWQGLDFVMGFEVKLSNAHPRFDICDHMKGEYPKEFVFRGWHPGCICYKVPVLLPQDDFVDFLNDKAIPEKHVVKTIPTDAKKYIKVNAERFNAYASTPYWIKDNFKDGKMDLKKLKAIQVKP